MADVIFFCRGEVGNWSEAIWGIDNQLKLSPDVSGSTNLSFHISVGNDQRPSQKSGTPRENRHTPDFPDLSVTIPDDRGCLRFPDFIMRESLGGPGNSKIPDLLRFS